MLTSWRLPIFVAFDVLVARGEDVRALPLACRLKRLAKDARRWIALADGVPGQGRRLFELVAEMDLEGIVAKAPQRPLLASVPGSARLPRPELCR